MGCISCKRLRNDTEDGYQESGNVQVTANFEDVATLEWFKKRLVALYSVSTVEDEEDESGTENSRDKADLSFIVSMNVRLLKLERPLECDCTEAQEEMTERSIIEETEYKYLEKRLRNLGSGSERPCNSPSFIKMFQKSKQEKIVSEEAEIQNLEERLRKLAKTP